MTTPAIAPTQPFTITQTFDGYYMTSLVVDASSGPKGNANAYGILVPYNSQTGVMASADLAIRVPVYQIFTRIKNGEQDLAQIMGMILAYMQKAAKAQGLID